MKYRGRNTKMIKRTIAAVALTLMATPAYAEPIIDRLTTEMTRQQVIDAYTPKRATMGGTTIWDFEYQPKHLIKMAVTYTNTKWKDTSAKITRVHLEDLDDGPMVAARMEEKYGTPTFRNKETRKIEASYWNPMSYVEQVETFKWKTADMSITFELVNDDVWRMTYDVTSNSQVNF